MLEMERSGDPRIAWPLSGKPADRPRVGRADFADPRVVDRAAQVDDRVICGRNEKTD